MTNPGDREEEPPPQSEEAGGEAQAGPSPAALPGREEGPAPSPPEPVLGTPWPSSVDSGEETGAPAASPRSVMSPELAELRQREAERQAGRSKEWRWGVYLREFVETLLLAFLIFLAVRASLQNFVVEGQSMVPSLEDGQFLIVNKLAYATIDLEIFDWVPFFDAGEDSVHHLFGGPSRGDVIIFQSPLDPRRDFIKRVIGVPGDHIQIEDEKVYLNGNLLEEPYARSPTLCSQWCDVVVPKGQFFVMGDNRPNSSDSRAFGLVPESSIVGKALFSYWPLRDAGLAPNHSLSYASDEE